LKTLKTCFQLMEDGTLPEFSLAWTKQGTMQNGNCSILKTSESHKTEKESLLLDILETNVDEKYFLSEETTKRLIMYPDNKFTPIHSQQDTDQHWDQERIFLNVNSIKKPKVLVKEATKQGYAVAEVGDSINFSVPNSKTRRGRVGKQIAQTLDTACNQATLLNDYRIRKLTPRECWRLQGFPDWAFDKAQEVNSDSQLYKQSGNSVTETVIYEIAKRF